VGVTDRSPCFNYKPVVRFCQQRIARIHRLGQARPVRVINFVAKGTIEEGMLSVLAFKRSLSAGILDGASGEISLGGSRLNRFMKDVENVTRSMGEGEAVTPAEEVRSIVAAEDTESRDTGPDSWQALVQVGAQFIAALAPANNPNAAAHPWIERDPVTGAKPQRAIAGTGNRETTGRCAFCIGGHVAWQDCVMGSAG
jgi:hypothetical protein